MLDGTGQRIQRLSGCDIHKEFYGLLAPSQGWLVLIVSLKGGADLLFDALAWAVFEVVFDLGEVKRL